MTIQQHASFDSSAAELNATSKLVKAWESKNAKTAAKAGGVSLMALSLAACGGSSTTTTTAVDSSTATDTTTTVVTPVSLAASIDVDALSGTDGADSFTAQMSATAAVNTAGVLDTIAGGAGTDTLILVNTTANAASTGLTGANVTGIEVLDYRSTAAGDLDANFISSVTTIKLTNAAGAVDVTNLATTDTIEVVNGTATQDSSLTFAAAGVTGTTDSATVTLNGMTAASDLAFVGAVETMTVNVTGVASIADLDFDAGTTAINLNASANLAVTNQITNASVTTWTVTGAGNVDIDVAGAALGAAVTTYAAGDATGDQDIIVGATNTTVTTGAGDDDVNFGSNLDDDDTVDLGAGTDTLRLDLDSLTAGTADLSISNVEVLRLADTDANAGAINMDNLAIATIQFDGDEAGDNTGIQTLTDLASTTRDFHFVGGGTASGNQFFNGVVVDYDVTAASGAVNLVVNNGAGGDADDLLINKLDIDNAVTINLTATDIGTAAADELTITEIEGDDFTDLVATADGELIISNVDGAVVDTIDLAGAASGSSVTVTDSATALGVTLGAGVDIFIQNDTAGGLTLDAGAGNDTITGAAAAIDTLTLGAGNDDVISNDFDFEDVITDFAVGSDTYQIDLSVFETTDEIGAHSATIDLVDGNAASVTAGNFLVANEIAADEEIAAGDQLLVLVGADYSNATATTAVITGDREITTDTALSDDDAMLVLYSNGTDWTLAAMHNTSGGNATADIAAAEVALVDLVTFSDLGALDAGDYDATMFTLIA